ncbi:NUDIX hydrolase [Tenggerimyces flavus]|uniref:NUDIX hydrolase n=1 Tax=Tenggerimyces flavus TaxID=1708749 RepID=A0ABV7YMW9_9ACTN|nr:NUDIX domain-containing protein [Tenggerimyces flavus]MBM7785792.1 8-oxo-dGTP pyrophosphatase MutT (NUDIX family) [Tenggerimyces flavus]
MRLPNDFPVVERTAVRLVLLDAADQLLVFHTHDPNYPELGQWWELPGGGLDKGETYLEAAVRELREETGLVITPDEVGPPSWRRVSSFIYRTERRLQSEVIVKVRLTAVAPDIDESQREEHEADDYTGFRWMPLAEVLVSSERFYPGRLPELLPDFLAGKEIDEPFELWS